MPSGQLRPRRKRLLFQVRTGDLFSCRVVRVLGMLAGKLLGRWRGCLLCVPRRVLCFGIRRRRLSGVLRRILFLNRRQILLRLPCRLVIAQWRKKLLEMRHVARQSRHHGQTGL